MKKIILASVLLIFFIAGCQSSILDDPSTVIQYSIPERSHVKVTVENNYNTVVAVLVDGVLEAGSFNVLFESTNLAEGVYYYTLEVKGLSSSYYNKTTKYLLMVK